MTLAAAKVRTAKRMRRRDGMRRENGKFYTAITGGIGSGKSTVVRMIGKMGFPVFSADKIARDIYRDEKVAQEAAKLFPDCFEGGVADRKKLAAAAFADVEKLKKLDAITHPAIMEKMFALAARAEGEFVFFEIPLLFEGGYEVLFDRVIVVMRDQRARLHAVRMRDGLSEEEILSRIKNQSIYEKIDLSGHTVIYNDGDLSSLQSKVTDAVQEIVSKEN